MPTESSPPSAVTGRQFTLWRKIIAGLIVAAAAAFVVVVFALNLNPATISGSDFIQYWSAGVQIANHGNPYDTQATLQVERRNGLRDAAPTISFSPPVALEFALPLGLLSAKAGFTVWVMAQLASILLSVWLLWRRFGRPDSRYHLLGLVFAPVIACLMAGQLGTFFLLGFVLFLSLEDTHPFWAGAALVPFALKPHLVVVFGLALLITCIARRRYAPILGALATTAFTCAFSVLLDPEAWRQYAALLARLHFDSVFLPTAGMALRFLIDRSATWIEFVPDFIGCAWVVWYLNRRWSRWNWMEDGSLVMVVSIVAAPYGWLTDQAVLLPAVFAAFSGSRKLVPVLASFGAIEIAIMIQLLKIPSLASPAYLWTAPVWLLWLLYARTTGAIQPPAVTPIFKTGATNHA